MPHVDFKYNIEEDKNNIIRVINNPPIFDSDDLGRPLGSLSGDLIKKIREAKGIDEQERIVNNFLKENLESKKELIDEKINKFQKEWDEISDEYFKRLKHILGIDISEDTSYSAYLTNAGSCPFNPRFRTFMVRIEDSSVDTVVGHEIMHIEFIREFGFYCRDILKLTPEEFGKFQEASTFLLNDEMGDLFSRPDYGYKEHQKLRERLSKEWERNKDFDKLLKYFKEIIQ